MSLYGANLIHEVAGRWSGTRRTFEHSALYEFSGLAGRLRSALADDAEDPYWDPVLRSLTRARWLAATVPLPFNHAAVGLKDQAEIACPALRSVPEVAPELGAAADRLAVLLEGLAVSTDDPVGDVVRSALENGIGRQVVVLCSGRAVQDVQVAYECDFPDVEVLSPRDFLTGAVFDLAVAIGAAGWFPEPMFLAPRARSVEIVYPEWVPDTEPQLGLLAGAAASPADRFAAPPAPIGGGDFDLWGTAASDWMPETDWSALARAASAEDDSAEHPDELVEAQMFLLASGEAVFLEKREGSRLPVVVIDEKPSIHYAEVTALELGDFVLFRTAGDGDYIREIADSLMGTSVASLRSEQQRWKIGLRQAHTRLGTDGLVESLKREGSRLASRHNVRRWMMDESIKTRDQTDFRAICRVAGLEEEWERLWEAMRRIDGAHQKAAAAVRRQLAEEILEGDGRQLLSQGWGDFDVEEIKGEGALRVARIIDISPEVNEVSPLRLRKPFPVARALWPE